MFLPSGLPTELLDSVLIHLNTQDLRSLALTSKVLNLASTAHMYRSIKWTWSKEQRVLRPSIHILLRSITQNRSLAGLVEHVSFSTIGRPGSSERPQLQAQVPSADVAMVAEFVFLERLPSSGRLVEEFKDGYIDIAVALLLSQLPNLKTFSLGIDFQRQYNNSPNLIGLKLQRALLASASARTSKFQKLRQISLSTDLKSASDCFDAFVDTDQSLPLLCAPRLEYADIKIDEKPPFHRTAYPQSSSMLKSLRVHNSRVTETTVASILSTTPRLEDLEIDLWRASSWLDHHPGFDGATLMAGLSYTRASLRRLKISYSPYGDDNPDYADLGRLWLHRPLGTTLRSFSALEDLEISLIALLGWDPGRGPCLTEVLPTSLRELHIRDDGCQLLHWKWKAPVCLRALEDFFRVKEMCVPMLRRITLILEGPQGGWDQAEREKLVSMCEAVGIELEVRRDWCDDLLDGYPWSDSSDEE